MARKASGADQVASARELLRTAKTADELRTAQAVLLPLERGLSLEMTARVIGRSIGATCNLRTRYSKGAWWSCLPSGNRSLNDWASRLRYRRSIGCWRAMAGASRRLTRPIPGEILRRVRTGKKLQGNLDQIVASWNNDQPLLCHGNAAKYLRLWCRHGNRLPARANRSPTRQSERFGCGQRPQPTFLTLECTTFERRPGRMPRRKDWTRRSCSDTPASSHTNAI